MKTPSAPLLIGYDIGGTKIEIVLVSGEAVLFKKRLPTERDRGYAHILRVLVALFEDCLRGQNLKPTDISSIGLGLPGSVDPQSQKMLKGNTQVLAGKDVKGDLLKALNISIPVFTENDANCFALAETILGVGKHISNPNIVGVILGTGVGGGIIINGKIYSGKRGSGGEIGHIPLIGKDQKPCWCGQKDCAELYLSGSGLKESGIACYKQDLAHFIARLINIFDPHVVVLGGGVSLEDKIYEGLEALVASHLFYAPNPPPILKHKISDSAGGIGAALLGQIR